MNGNSQSSHYNDGAQGSPFAYTFGANPYQPGTPGSATSNSTVRSLPSKPIHRRTSSAGRMSRPSSSMMMSPSSRFSPQSPASPSTSASTMSSSLEMIPEVVPAQPSPGRAPVKPQLSDAQKKANHIASEKKRRTNIREQYDKLAEMTPGMEGQGRSEGRVLEEVVKRGRELVAQRAALIQEIERRGGVVDPTFKKF